MSLGIYLAEHGLLPDQLLAYGIRQQIKLRIKECIAYKDKMQQFISSLGKGPAAIEQEAANDQHYEVPAVFYTYALGKHLKYSSAYWPEGVHTLDEAEAAMLKLSCTRAELQNGQDILEIGCGWGSLTLWMAEHYPASKITAISNSASQREYILGQCARHGFDNVTVITNDVTLFETDHQFDRIVSIECFEHLRNYAYMFEKMSGWLKDQGLAFLHVFCHDQYTYPFEGEDDDNWMARHFFTGGIMPSYNLFEEFNQHLHVTNKWSVNGKHYERTAQAWLDNMDTHKNKLNDMFPNLPSKKDQQLQFNRWRMFFMSCRELFGFNNGQDWFVGHYKLSKVT